MLPTFDPTDDFAVVSDGVEAVTLLRRGNTGDAGTAIAHALRRATNISEAMTGSRSDVRKKVASAGRYIAADVVWHLPSAELVGAPHIGDVIVDAGGNRWTILEVKQTMFGSRWRCEARNVAIALGLDDTISVLKASYAKGGCGAAEPMWRTWKSGVRARIQPVESKVVGGTQMHGTTVHYRIFVEENLDVDHTCCICGADGVIYTITGATGAERIGELQVIDAEVRR
jgi:hypothetical protein